MKPKQLASSHAKFEFCLTLSAIILRTITIILTHVGLQTFVTFQFPAPVTFLWSAKALVIIHGFSAELAVTHGARERVGVFPCGQLGVDEYFIPAVFTLPSLTVNDIS